MHEARGRSRKDPPGATPQRGPERVRRGASPAPPPRGANSRHHEPRSRPASTCPAQPPSKTGGAEHPIGEGTTSTGKPTGALRAPGPDEAQRTKAGPRGTLERHTAGHNHSTGERAKQYGHRVPQTREARTTPRASARGPRRAREHAGRTGIPWRKVRLTKQRNVDLTTNGLWGMPRNTGWVPVKERGLLDWAKLKNYVPLHK